MELQELEAAQTGARHRRWRWRPTGRRLVRVRQALAARRRSRARCRPIRRSGSPDAELRGGAHEPRARRWPRSTRLDAAIAALQQALRYDPAGHPILNNLAVICREQGRLDEAVEAGRTGDRPRAGLRLRLLQPGARPVPSRAIRRSRETRTPLGMRNDPQKNMVQACRLAVARAAAGDSRSGNRSRLGAIAEACRPKRGAGCLGEAEETVEALLSLPRQTGSAGLTRVLDVVRDG